MLKIITIIWVVAFLAAAFFLIREEYFIDRDIDSVVERAQLSANAEDMLGYVNQLENNLKEYHLTSGYMALVFKTPANDMALYYKSVHRIGERLEQIKALPRNETAYQVALDDLRGTLRELPGVAWDYIWVHYWFVIIGILVLGIILGCFWLRE